MLASLDWIVIILFLVIFIGFALSFTGKAGKNLNSFFLGGRSLPWYIAGISMVATTFAADTPLAVTELVAKNGISANWLWWNMLAGGMLTTFFFAKLWHRADVLTEVELIELRYSGTPAALLRGFKAVYLGVFMNLMIIGWVNVALIALLEGFFSISHSSAIMYTAIAMVIVAVYSSLSGLLGVAMSDVIQFITAMVGCILLAIFVVNSEEVGGITNMKANLDDWTLSFFPTVGSSEGSTGSALAISVGAFFSYFAIQWWASWYPGAEPGGGGYVAQRMMSAKDEKNAIYATLFFQIGHYCIRPWPWILVALCALIIYPDLDDTKMGFVYAIRDFLPPGIKGLLLVSFLAAYMSTISTQLNWGASYVVNDLYKRFMNPGGSDKTMIMVSRLVTFILMILGIMIATQMDSITGVWEFVFQCGAGLGLVLILRWYWWRINAWSEITATLVPFIIYGISKFLYNSKLSAYQAELGVTELSDAAMKTFNEGAYWLQFPGSFFLTVAITTIAWVVVTYFTKPTDQAHLTAFYKKVKPDGWWSHFKQLNNEDDRPSEMGTLVICWLSAVSMTYAILFTTGKLVLAMWTDALMWGVVAIVSLVILRIFIGKTRFLT